MKRYNVIRFFYAPGRRNKIIERGLTLEDAQAHCNDPETSSATCTSASGKRLTQRAGAWFDGYEEA